DHTGQTHRIQHQQKMLLSVKNQFGRVLRQIPQIGTHHPATPPAPTSRTLEMTGDAAGLPTSPPRTAAIPLAAWGTRQMASFTISSIHPCGPISPPQTTAGGVLPITSFHI